MARFILIAAVVGTPPRSTHVKLPRGSTVASDAGSALANDVVWPALCSNPSPINMLPLDAAASAIMGLPITTLAAVATSSAGGACGENL
jgi:hypothetical protein